MNIRFILVRLASILAAVLVTGGCRSQSPTQTGVDAANAPVQFTDISQQAGLKFKHNKGAFGIRLMPETMGSGVAFIDFDGDGYQDIFLVNGRNWTQAEIKAFQNGTGRAHPELNTVIAKRPPSSGRATNALFHNNGDGTFRDVTRSAGLDIEMYGMGACVGDYDNDGRSDLYVTAYGRNYLFRNLGGGRFREVAQTASVRDGGWSTSAAWLDFDRDGRLDLFVCHYLIWSPAIDYHQGHRGRKMYSAPEYYKGDYCRLYRNAGGGRFVDVSVRAGVRPSPTDKSSAAARLMTKGLALAICDSNNDLWPDILVVSDLEPNLLFQNNHDGTFEEVSDRAGIAISNRGMARAGMGIDAADIDHSNRESFVISNYSSEMLGLYLNRGQGVFTDVAPGSSIGKASFPFLSFGCIFTDFDNDGWPDIFVANGHVNDLVEQVYPDRTYAERPLLFRNLGRPQPGSATLQGAPVSFEEVGLNSGIALQKPLVGRGLAQSDIDLDGDLDVLMSTSGGAPLLLRNDGGHRNHSIRVVLRGIRSNRDAIGATVWAEAGKESVRRHSRSGSSYLSQSELPVLLGLGSQTEANVVVRWPSGKLMQLGKISAGQIITVQEDKGIVSRRPFHR